MVDIPLVSAGDVEGALVKSGGLGFEGVDLELVDASGQVVATARSDFDGFFLFEGVAYGDYKVRIVRESASAAGLAEDLGVKLTVSGDMPTVRLGSIVPNPVLKLASAQ